MDIRRWVQGMGYPNPVHFDEEAAAQSPYGTIVAPQSFLLACCPGHGSIPAIVGVIPGSHVVFGGDEFWFNGPAIRPGDLMRAKRRFDGYSLAETKFAGPTMFCRGDSTYTNQRKEVVGRQRSTMVRYRADLARERGHYQDTAETPTWTDEQLGEIERQKSEWVQSGSRGDGPAEVGESLMPRPIGPHTTAQFVTELRALPFQVWGATYMEGTYYGDDAGLDPRARGRGVGYRRSCDEEGTRTRPGERPHQHRQGEAGGPSPQLRLWQLHGYMGPGLRRVLGR